MTAPTERLLSVEVARGLAALAVVAFHANASARWYGGPDWAVLRPLAHGVDFFFVLSGFIIAHVHGADVGRSTRAGLFVRKRAIRLLPMLWLAVGAAVVGNWLLGERVDGWAVARSALLLPLPGEVMPDVVWTLRHEALFYLVFALAIRWPRCGVALAGAVLVGSVAQLALGLAGRPLTGGLAVVLSPYNIDFALGALVAVGARRWPPRVGGAWLWGGGVVSAGLLATVAWSGGGGFVILLAPRAMATAVGLGLAFAAVLRGLVALDGRWRPGVWWLRLGSASYAVYLLHTLSNAVVQRPAALWPDWLLAMGAGHLALVVVGVAVGLAVDRWFDRPVRRGLGRWFVPAHPGGAAGRTPPPAV